MAGMLGRCALALRLPFLAHTQLHDLSVDRSTFRSYDLSMTADTRTARQNSK